MKKILSLCLLAGLALSAAAQRRAAENAVEKSMEKKYGEPGKEKLDDWMSGHLMNVKVEPSYDFSFAYTMHSTTYRNGEKHREADIHYYMNPSRNLFATDGSDDKKRKKDDMLMVYDYKANAMLMLNTTDKTGMAMNLNAFMSKEKIEEREQNRSGGKMPEGFSCSKTGKTQTILGYKCEEYICKDEKRNSRSEIWITRELKGNTVGGAGGLSPLWGSAQQAGGMLMAGKFYKEDQLESSMEVTNINTSANFNINTAEYKFAGR